MISTKEQISSVNIYTFRAFVFKLKETYFTMPEVKLFKGIRNNLLETSMVGRTRNFDKD